MTFPESRGLIADTSMRCSGRCSSLEACFYCGTTAGTTWLNFASKPIGTCNQACTYVVTTLECISLNEVSAHDVSAIAIEKKANPRADTSAHYLVDELVEMFGAPRNPPPPSSDNKPPSVRVPEDAPSTPTALPAAVDKLSLDDDDETRSTPRPAEETVAATARRFELISLGIDRRLLLNRKKLIKMYRIWLQGRWRKPLSAQGAATASSPTTTV